MKKASAQQGIPLVNWGYEWLVSDAFNDLENCFAELVARGYQGVVLDPCPHLIAANEFEEVFEHAYITLPPHREYFAEHSVKIEPRARLLVLLALAKEHQVQLWFSSSFLPDSHARRSFIRRPENFVKVWSALLAFVEDNKLGDAVAGIDFCQGFPLSSGAYGTYRRIFKRHPFNPVARLLPWNAKIRRHIDDFMLTVPRTLRALYPQYSYGVSAAPGAEAQYHDLSTHELDFLGLALWQDDDMKFNLSNTLLRTDKAPFARLRNRVVAQWYAIQKDYWAEQWHERLKEQLHFCRQRRITPILIDGYLKVSEASAYWPWVKKVSAKRVELAIGEGVQYMVVSHYSRPSNESCWNDAAWHKSISKKIQTGKKAKKKQYIFSAE